MKVKIDEEACIGCALCAQITPIFEMDDDVAIVKSDPANQEEEKDARDALESCPVDAILIVD